MWIGSATSIRGTATQKNSTGLVVVAARNRNGRRGVNATSTIGKASSAGVSAVPSAEIAESTAQAPRIQRVLTFQFARSSRSSPVGAEPARAPNGATRGACPAGTPECGRRDRDCEHVTIVRHSAPRDDQAAQPIRGPEPSAPGRENPCSSTGVGRGRRRRCHRGQASGVADRNTRQSLTMTCWIAPGSAYLRLLPSVTTLWVQRSRTVVGVERGDPLAAGDDDRVVAAAMAAMERCVADRHGQSVRKGHRATGARRRPRRS